MGNYKFIEDIIDRYVKGGKPFLIIKYSITSFNGLTNNIYEVATLGTKRLQYLPIERDTAKEIIEKYDLPLLHELDNRNMIWGDKKFREIFKEKNIGI